MSLRPFWVAVQFLTVLPVTLEDAPDNDDYRQSLLWYPLVGGLLGALLLIAASRIAQPQLGSAFIIVLWAFLTGGLHLDGLADCADAWVGGRGDRERTLTLLKDPCCGAMAIIAVVLILVTKFAAVDTLIANHCLLPILTTPMLARTAVPILFATTPYVRSAGLGSVMQGLKLDKTLISVVLAVATFAIYLSAWMAVVVVVGSGVLLALLRRASLERLGGFTGDVAGAVVECLEAVALWMSAALS